MKEFEKQFPRPEVSGIIDSTHPFTEWKEKRVGWRAALERLQHEMKFGCAVAYSEADVLMAIKKVIEKELQDD